MNHDWKSYNRGLTPRELTRVMNGKYKPPVDSEYARHGYTPDQWLEVHQEYCRKNARKIQHLTNRNKQLKEQYELRNKEVSIRDSTDGSE